MGHIVLQVKCDLEHINRGWDSQTKDYKRGRARLSFREEDVLRIVFAVLESGLLTTSSRTPPDFVMSRFIADYLDESMVYRVVLDLLEQNDWVVVTIYPRGSVDG